MNGLNTFTQPKEITHGQYRIFRDKIKEWRRHRPCQRQIRNDNNTIFLLARQLCINLKCTDTLYFVSKEIDTIRILRCKRKNINDTTAYSILSRFINIIYVFETVAMQYLRNKTGINMFTYVQLKSLIVQFFLRNDFLRQCIGIGNNAQTLFSFLQTAEHLGT